jgi:hypothetical protein
MALFGEVQYCSVTGFAYAWVQRVQLDKLVLFMCGVSGMDWFGAFSGTAVWVQLDDWICAKHARVWVQRHGSVLLVCRYSCMPFLADVLRANRLIGIHQHQGLLLLLCAVGSSCSLALSALLLPVPVLGGGCKYM